MEQFFLQSGGRYYRAGQLLLLSGVGIIMWSSYYKESSSKGK